MSTLVLTGTHLLQRESIYFILTYLLTNYRYRCRAISSISYQYRIEFEKVISKHHYSANA